MNFESLWDRNVRLLDEPNHRGAGTSAVGVADAARWPEFAAHARIFIKRQQAFFCRPPWNAFRRTPTLRREVRFLNRARALGVGVPKVIHYTEGSDDRALLLLEEIDGTADLEHALATATLSDRATVLRDVSAMLARLHDARILHGAVYPKHVLIDVAAPHRCWLIDFEKARHVATRSRAAERDLTRLLRHAPFIVEGDLEALLSAYDARAFRTLRRRLGAVLQRARAPQSNR